MTADERITALEKRVEELDQSNNFRHLMLGLAAILATMTGMMLPL
jgi:hypothetical protein